MTDVTLPPQRGALRHSARPRHFATPVSSEALDALVGRSAAMESVRRRIRRFGATTVPILIQGETGTGKELCARALFELSERAPFVPVNCAAIPEGLADSQFFGHTRGAFTGAVESRRGLVEVADGGTLFLDELAEIPKPVQAKLLRTLESGEYLRVGDVEVRESHFRILAATSVDLAGDSDHAKVRGDLLHRVRGVTIWMPPLRARLEDVPQIVDDLLRRYRARTATSPTRMTPEARALLMQYPWPGNVRELRNMVEAAAALAGSADEVELAHLLECLDEPRAEAHAAPGMRSLAEVRLEAERRAILGAIDRAGGNRERAARLLRISPATLYRKLGVRGIQVTGPDGSQPPALSRRAALVGKNVEVENQPIHG